MPHYFFHVYDDLVALDPEGINLAGADEAREYAVKGARCLAAEEVKNGHFTGSHRIEIVEDGVDAVEIVRFDDAVKLHP